MNWQTRELGTPQQEVVTLPHHKTVAEALAILAKHRILSAPLVISPGLEDLESLNPTDQAPSLVGWVDIRALVAAFLRHLEQGAHSLPTSMLQLMSLIDKEAPRFNARTLITLDEGGEDRALVYQADAGMSVLAAIRQVFLDQGGAGRVVHRLAVFDASGDITRVVSQLDVLRFLVAHEQELGPLAAATLEQLRLLALPHKLPLLSLSPHTPTVLAFERMAKAGLTAAAVVSEDGDLVANLSVSDCRGIQPDHLSILALPVAEFLALSHGTSYLGYAAKASQSAHHPFFAGSPASSGGSPRAPPSPRVRGAPPQPEPVRLITCTRQSPFSEVLHALVDNDVHRVYVVEEGEGGQVKPVGVITPTDILRLLSGNDGGGGAAASPNGNAKRALAEAAAAEDATALGDEDGGKKAKVDAMTE